MNKANTTWSVLMTAGLLFPSSASAQQDSANRISFNARFGFNITAKLRGVQSFPARITPDGDAYNYDDGYVLTDVSGNFGGQTWYWGYDSTVNQISGNTVLMNRSTLIGDPSAGSFGNGANQGAELVYSRRLGGNGDMHFGFELAPNFLDLSLKDNGTFAGSVRRRTDAYPFTPGTTPPAAPPPYQGRFNNPGFVIGDTPVSSTTTVVPGATVFDRRKFDSTIWGLRLGPFVELPLGQRVNLTLSGGFAAALLHSEMTWSQTLALPGGATQSASGNGHDSDMLLGGYAAWNLLWQFHDRWNMAGGLQYQNLGDYQHSFGGRRLTVDMGSSLFVTLGVGYRF